MKTKIVVAFFLMMLSGVVFAKNTSEAIVIHANGDKVQFERALKLASNMREVLTKAKFEVVVIGTAVKFLTYDSDEVPLIQKIQAEGINIIACGRSIQTDSVKESDLSNGVTVTQFGAVHIVNRQKQGWQYLRP